MGVTTLLYGRKAIDVQWCTRWKSEKKNEVKRYKARMVVKVYGHRWVLITMRYLP